MIEIKKAKIIKVCTKCKSKQFKNRIIHNHGKHSKGIRIVTCKNCGGHEYNLKVLKINGNI